MFRLASIHNASLSAHAGTLLSVSILQKLVDKGIFTPTEANEVVGTAVGYTGGMDAGWAKTAREVLTVTVMPKFPKD